MERTPHFARHAAHIAPCLLLTAVVAVGCGDTEEPEELIDTTNLPGIWEASVEKPFEENDPEQFTFKVEETGGKLVAHICLLDRRDGAFEGPIESFTCEEDSVPVTDTGDSIEINWADKGVRLQIEGWMSKDMLSGAALVAKWAELGETPFTAKRIPSSELPQ